MQITLGPQYNVGEKPFKEKSEHTQTFCASPGFGRKKYLGTTKASTRMILVHVQKMYNIFRILIGVPDYSSSESSNVRR